METSAQLLGIAVVICYNPLLKKYLCVHQKNGSWWVPAGRVEAPELFSQGAIRECKEEAGIDIELTGILRVEQSPGSRFQRLRIIFSAEPKDKLQKPKNYADSQSRGAEYFTLEQILNMKKQWRAEQIYDWPNYLQKGGQVYSLDLLKEEIIG